MQGLCVIIFDERVSIFMCPTHYKVLLTGASGHLGANILRVLSSRNYKVRVLVRSDTRAIDGIPCEVVKGDLLDFEILKKALDGVDAVIHSAALISISGGKHGLVWKTNVEGLQNVLRAMEEMGVRRLVYVSSIHAFKDTGDVVNEDSPLNFDGSEYDRSKAKGIEMVRQYSEKGLDIITICPTALVGPYDFKPSFFGRFLLSLAKGKVPALVEGSFDFVDVMDVAEAVVNGLEMGDRGDIFITSGQYLKIVELAEIWGEIAGVRVPKVVVPLGLAKMGGWFFEKLGNIFNFDPIYTYEAIKALYWRSPISSQKARERLKFHPRLISETLKDTYLWFKDYGYL